MAGPGLAILSGLLHGLGNIGAVETQRRERERAAAEKEKDRAARSAERFTSLPFDTLPDEVRAAYTPDSAGNARVLLAKLPFLLDLMKEGRARKAAESAYPDEATAPPVGAEPPDVRGLMPTQRRLINEDRQQAGAAYQGLLDAQERERAQGREPITEGLGIPPQPLFPEPPDVLAPTPRPVSAGPAATPGGPMSARDFMAYLNRQARNRQITGAQHAEQMGKLRAEGVPKYTALQYEDERGQQVAPWNPLAGSAGPAQRLGGPKPRQPRELEEKMAIIDAGMAAMYREDPKKNPAPGTDAWAVKRADLVARMGIPLEGSAAGLVSGRTLAGTPPGQVPVHAGTAASIEAPLGTTRDEAAAMNRIPMTAEQQNKQAAMRGATAILDKLGGDVKDIFSGDASGVPGRLANTVRNVWRVALQGDTQAATYHAQRKVLAFNLARASGSVGATTDADAERVDAALPIVFPIPDSPEVAAKKMRDLPAVLQEIADRSANRPAGRGPALATPPALDAKGRPQPTAPGPLSLPLATGQSDPTRNRRIKETATGQLGWLMQGTPLPPGVELVD